MQLRFFKVKTLLDNAFNTTLGQIAPLGELTSGARYSGVPQKVFVMSPYEMPSLHRPKSVILMCPSLSSIRFSSWWIKENKLIHKSTYRQTSLVFKELISNSLKVIIIIIIAAFIMHTFPSSADVQGAKYYYYLLLCCIISTMIICQCSGNPYFLLLLSCWKGKEGPIWTIVSL